MRRAATRAGGDTHTATSTFSCDVPKESKFKDVSSVGIAASAAEEEETSVDSSSTLARVNGDILWQARRTPGHVSSVWRMNKRSFPPSEAHTPDCNSIGRLPPFSNPRMSLMTLVAGW